MNSLSVKHVCHTVVKHAINFLLVRFVTDQIRHAYLDYIVANFHRALRNSRALSISRAVANTLVVCQVVAVHSLLTSLHSLLTSMQAPAFGVPPAKAQMTFPAQMTRHMTFPQFLRLVI